MLNKLKSLIRNWLGITDEMHDVWLCVTQLQDESFTVPMEQHGGVVDAVGSLEYTPNQTGNVVVAEPKMVTVARSKK